MTLKIAFIDETLGDYTPDTPRLRPLGGTQSAACYLAECLAAAGAAVVLVNGVFAAQTVRGVHCQPALALPADLLDGMDALVLVGSVSTPLLQRLAGQGRRLILWAHHAADQPAVGNLGDAAVRDAFAEFAFVSRWQMDGYVAAFGLDPERCRIMRNGMAPAFAGLFGPGEDIGWAKPWPPVLAYASTPFRGLDVLLDSFARIRAAVPGTTLRVFSSLESYGVSLDRDPFADLYRRCRETDGVTHVGALSQAALAAELRRAACLAYPNRFAETSCIAVMEAMAAGCLVVSSRLGALPETTAGFARLMPVPTNAAEHATGFADLVTGALEWLARDPGAGGLLRAQVEHAKATLSWPDRAKAWLGWLSGSETGGPAMPGDRLRAARIHAAAGDADRAVHLCRAMLADNADDAAAWRLLAECEAARGQRAPAAEALVRAWRVGGRQADAEIAARFSGLLGALTGAEEPSLPERVRSAEYLAEMAAEDASLHPHCETLAGITGRLASAGLRTGDGASAHRAYGVLMRLRPGDARTRLAFAWSLTQLARHEAALEAVSQALREGGGDLLASQEARSLIALCLEAAETAAPEALAADPATAARLYRLVAQIGPWLGEEAHSAAAAADAAQAVVSGTGDRTAARARAAVLVARRRGRQGRHEEAIERLREVADTDGEALAALVTAELSQAQERLVSALRTLVTAGVQGRAPAGWRQEAGALMTAAEAALRPAHSDEARRTSLWAGIRGLDALLAYRDAEALLPVLAPPPADGRRLYDCFQFYNELDLLEIRLEELAPVVHRFVLVEATHTHAGTRKPLHFAENRARFAAHADKIIHVVLEDDAGGFAWEREARQREAIARGLQDCDSSDMILVSDVDEIPRAEIAAALRFDAGGPPGLLAPHLDLYLYFLDLKSPEPWISMAAAPWELMRRIGPNRARYLAKQGIGRVLPNAGWHFTWMGGRAGFLAKMQAFAHREMIGGFEQDAANQARLDSFYETGSFADAPVPGMWTRLSRVCVDASFPPAIRARADRFRSQGWFAPVRSPSAS
ncbi:MAG TPA: glycosyltransferase [Azospirillaceae bacterium]|nr:glycosyltransferase [Azospirillaceae bacterium]